jgi:hypothetical protein
MKDFSIGLDFNARCCKNKWIESYNTATMYQSQAKINSRVSGVPPQGDQVSGWHNASVNL